MTRLYVGNLAPSLSEYSLIALCAQHGKVTALDFLYHTAGNLKGKPRGFAFVKYDHVQEAERAREALDGKLVQGRKLSVSYATETSTNPDDVRLAALTGSGRSSIQQRNRDGLKPTTLSLLKGKGVAGVSTDRKILALEAKLANLRKGKPALPTLPSSTSSSSTSTTTAAFLDSILLPDQPASTEADKGKAGLPARPWFESEMPDLKGGGKQSQ